MVYSFDEFVDRYNYGGAGDMPTITLEDTARPIYIIDKLSGCDYSSSGGEFWFKSDARFSVYVTGDIEEEFKVGDKVRVTAKLSIGASHGDTVEIWFHFREIENLSSK